MGYIHPDAGNEQECVDINECDMFDNLCVFGRCENKEGSFQCICDPGYILDSSGGNCTGQLGSGLYTGQFRRQLYTGQLGSGLYTGQFRGQLYTVQVQHQYHRK